MSIIGERIKSTRIARGISQEDLGKQTGYTRSAISRIESGQRDPNRESLIQMSRILGVSVSYLMGAEEGKEQALEEAFNSRPEMRALFSVAQSATKEDIEQAIKIIEALKK